VGFQPFGYRFEIKSNLPPKAAKAAIRSKKAGIFDPKDGARGWIAGPFICLWFSAFDRYGPMLFGLISADSFGTRVHGRAGSDLNGVLMFTLITAGVVVMMITDGAISATQPLAFVLVFLIGAPLIHWFAHKDRKDADPLVHFLRKALAQPDARSRSTAATRKLRKGLRLVLNGDYLEGPVTDEGTEAALMRVGKRGFLIIESAPQNYLQTALHDGGYVLEVRKGGPSQHYKAERYGRAAGSAALADDAFTFEEICETMSAYIAGADMPRFVKWRPLETQA